MSGKLKRYIEQEMKKQFPDAALQDLDKFALVIAVAVQKYLNDDVKTKPEKPTEKAPGPVTHVHIQTAHKLKAP